MEQLNFFGVPLIHLGDFTNLVLRFGFNLLVTFLIVSKIYRPFKNDKSYVFTYYIFNILIFFICYMMTNVKLDLGFAFGLFALFSIMRYRTTTIGIKEMTYMFSVVCIGVMNALGNHQMSIAEQLFSNFAIVAAIFFLERLYFKNPLQEIIIRYEKIEFIPEVKRSFLLEDLKERTGLNVVDVEVQDINFLSDSAMLRVFFKA